jgi:3-hydroxyacyl-CoA dehydrogenase
MSTGKFHVRKAAVLGAGVMGAQIAAHLSNAGIPVVLFELAAKEGDPNGLVNKAIANLSKLSPAPLAEKSVAAGITPANYDQHLDLINDCDLIIEAVAERMDIKKAVYDKVEGRLKDGAIFASNTSGLSITTLAESLPEAIRDRFCGVHFFNPPRYMYLVEIIPTKYTAASVMDSLESFLTTALGKGVVRAKDTPNFIGNRIGVFSMLACMHHTKAFGLGFDVVDALTGPLIGRPKSATYRTADVVGLDTMGHVIGTMHNFLPDDPWHSYFSKPDWLAQLIEAGALGQKSGKGIYEKRGKDIYVLDLASGGYRPTGQEPSAAVEGALRQKTWGERLAKLRGSDDAQAQFMWACFRDLFHYAAVHLADIADTARDVDLAVRWGYGWKEGPFEIWQQAGWEQVTSWIEEDMAAGKTMAKVALPGWVKSSDAVHFSHGSYSPTSDTVQPRSALPVYRRQAFPDPVLTESFDQGSTVFEDDSVRLWSHGDDIAVLSFKSKMNTIGPGVIDGIHRAVDTAEREFGGMVIWQTREPFSAGADLSAAIPIVAAGKIDEFKAFVARFQATSMKIKYSAVPVVSAVRGLCLGGGCEFQMHSAKTVAALESYIGLVEAGVGLLPAGGGLKEIALRCSRDAIAGDVFGQVQTYFETIAMAKVATSALEAKASKLLRATDTIVYNSYELLHVARAEARALAEAGYRPPMPLANIRVAGDVGTATIRSVLTNMYQGHFVSEHDAEVARRIALVLCGGDIEKGSEVDEEWLLHLEREHFVELAMMPKTQERIAHTLRTGKPLRN